MTPGERLPRGVHGAGADDFCGDGCTRTHWIKRGDAVNAIAAAVAEMKEACVQALIGEMYLVDADEIAEYGPSLPANQVIKTCIAAIRALP